MTRRAIYCDYNAGAPVLAEAAVAAARALAIGGNPSSVHSRGRAAKALLEDARERIAALVDARPDNVVFTSGATEALHLVLDGAEASAIILSASEHDAIHAHVAHLGVQFTVTPIDGEGRIDQTALAAALTQSARPALVAVQLANNETGVIQDVPAIAALCRQHGAMLLVDAAQAFGRVDVSIRDLDATYLVISSHKIGGPPGAGALVLAPGAVLSTRRHGGGQEQGRRPGTENVAACAGFAVAAEHVARIIQSETARLRSMRDRFEAKLPKDAVIFGAGAARLPNTSNFAVPNLSAETAVIALDLDGVAVSSGAACSSGKVRSSRVLAAMGVPSDLARCAVRVSFGHNSHDEDVEAVLAALSAARSRQPASARAPA